MWLLMELMNLKKAWCTQQGWMWSGNSTWLVTSTSSKITLPKVGQSIRRQPAHTALTMKMTGNANKKKSLSCKTSQLENNPNYTRLNSISTSSKFPSLLSLRSNCSAKITTTVTSPNTIPNTIPKRQSSSSVNGKTCLWRAKPSTSKNHHSCLHSTSSSMKVFYRNRQDFGPNTMRSSSMETCSIE